MQEERLKREKQKREQESAKAIQDQNAALEKSDYTFDTHGKIVMVKKNTRFANLGQGGSFTVKDPPTDNNDKKNAKKKKPGEGKEGNISQVDVDN